MSPNHMPTILGILDDCAALLEKHSTAFPQPDSVGGKLAEPALDMLWLGMVHALRTIRGMTRLLREDDGNVVLACTLLRSFYELSARLLWASREPDGWRRLQMCFAREITKWANDCRGSPNPGIAKLASEMLQSQNGIAQWKDSLGNDLKPAPGIQQILDGVESHDRQKGLPSGHGNSGQRMYAILYRILCRASHAHIEVLTGEFDEMYSYHAGVGACCAAANLLAAFIYRTEQSPDAVVSKMLAEFSPLLRRCAN